MSWPSHFRLCYNCGGVSEARRDWATGTVMRTLDNCDHCSAPLAEDDDYNGLELPRKHRVDITTPELQKLFAELYNMIEDTVSIYVDAVAGKITVEGRVNGAVHYVVCKGGL